MLASTVQFSRYGRAHLYLAPTSSTLSKQRSEAVHPDPVVRPVSHISTDLRLGVSPSPQDPTVCHASTTQNLQRFQPEGVLSETLSSRCHVDVPSMSLAVLRVRTIRVLG
jgi:hypothetical protein